MGITTFLRSRIYLLVSTIGVVVVSNGLANQDENGKVSLQLPGRSWSLVFQAPNFTPTEDGPILNKKGWKFAASSADQNFNLSVYIEPQPSSISGTASTCRTYYTYKLKKGQAEIADFETHLEGKVAVSSYVIPTFQGMTVRQKNVNAFLAKDGHCIDVHVSKVLFVQADQVIFDQINQSLQIQ